MNPFIDLYPIPLETTYDVVANIPTTVIREGVDFYATDIETLFKWTGSAWKPFISFAAVTFYVDKTNGSDAVGQGYSATTGATATIQYAIDLIPPINGGNIIINITGEQYDEKVTIQGKMFSGNYTLELIGTLSSQEVVSSATVTAGNKNVIGMITKAGVFSGDNYQNMLAYFNTDDEYRIIDGHGWSLGFDSGSSALAGSHMIKGQTSGAWGVVGSVSISGGSWGGGNAAGTLTILKTSGTFIDNEPIDIMTDSTTVSVANAATTDTPTANAVDSDNLFICGMCPSSTAQDVTIYDWSTKLVNDSITDRALQIADDQVGIVLNSIEFGTKAGSTGVDSDHVPIEFAPYSSSTMKNCKILQDNTLYCFAARGGSVLVEHSFIYGNRAGGNRCLFVYSGGSLEVLGLKLKAFATANPNWGFVPSRNGLIHFKQVVIESCSHGAYIDLYSHVSPIGNANVFGGSFIRHSNTGLYAINGGLAVSTNARFMGNITADKNPSGASDPSYIT